MQLFGFEIKKKDSADKAKSFVAPSENSIDDGEGVVVQGAGSHHGTYFDQNWDRVKTDRKQIELYRSTALHAECDAAVEDIINEAIVTDNDSAPVRLIVDDLEASDKVKKIILEEFDEILSLMNFNWLGSDLFRIWYVDGRIFFHKVIDTANPKKGLIEIRHVDSTKIKKIKEIEKATDAGTGVDYVKNVNEYYIFQEGGVGNADTGLRT